MATVVLNDPPLNLLGARAKADLTRVFEDIAGRTEVRVVVLRGAGSRAFSAGADIREFPERIRTGSARNVSRSGQRMTAAIRGCGRPVIASIDGVAFGAGLEVAVAADFRLASHRAQFAFPEVTRGVFPGNGGSQLLTRLIGPSRAKRLMMFGAPIDSGEAFRIGLVDQVVPDGRLDETVERWARELAERPAVAVGCVRDLVDRGGATSLEEGLAMEAELFARVFATDDVREGVAAFFERRPPSFGHR
ncbi:enoyl-CoA hydratase/isomerase family protein [Pseudonocardia sp. MH-G8]|uniref:enoyl-CoA hydratase/isomerase family protein n=1 Tax=Pseudonocardia sp. MH-G8 TaxID=1854588 RepID=UPI0013045A7D|nr:enoyl-CoA hydratase-related protein [Pseudonocardia sp. MH-G8]